MLSTPANLDFPASIRHACGHATNTSPHITPSAMAVWGAHSAKTTMTPHNSIVPQPMVAAAPATARPSGATMLDEDEVVIRFKRPKHVIQSDSNDDDDA